MSTTQPDLSLTLPFIVSFHISRAQDDGDSRTCIIHWDGDFAFADVPWGFVLLHHDADGGLSRVDFRRDHVFAGDEAYLTLDADDPLHRNGGKDASVLVQPSCNEQSGLHELAPGGEASHGAAPPECFYDGLRAGETYTLLFPGWEVPLWEWGTFEDLAGQEIRHDPARPPLVIPGGASVTFTAKSEAKPWPGRARCRAKRSFMDTNSRELSWRNEQAKKRRSPPPVGEPERVYVVLTAKQTPTPLPRIVVLVAVADLEHDP